MFHCAQWVALFWMGLRAESAYGGGIQSIRYRPSTPLSDVLFNPKYASHVYKVTVVVDNLGNLVWICDLMLGTTADVMIWNARGRSHSHGQFFHFEMGAHDGAYKGLMCLAVFVVNYVLTVMNECSPS